MSEQLARLASELSAGSKQVLQLDEKTFRSRLDEARKECIRFGMPADLFTNMTPQEMSSLCAMGAKNPHLLQEAVNQLKTKK